MVRNPVITQRELKERLDMEGLHLDRKYLGTLVNGLHAERVKRADRATLNYALASFQDAMIEIVQAGWDIVNDPSSRNMDKTLAMREIREAQVAVFEKMFDAGIFERKLGTLEGTIRNTPLPEERKQAIAAVFENWGLLSAPKQEDERPTSEPSPTQ